MYSEIDREPHRQLLPHPTFEGSLQLLCESHEGAVDWLETAATTALVIYVNRLQCCVNHKKAASPYLCDNLQSVSEVNQRRLRSPTSNAIVVPATRLVTVGDCAFPVAGSRLWNSLPTDVMSATTLPVFCSRLKSHLFSVSFPA